jgi:hypothetical protein
MAYRVVNWIRLAPEMALFFDVLLRGEGKRLLPRCSAVHRLLPDYVAGQ